MNFCSEILPQKVLETAMGLISNAQEEIIAIMDVDEEIKSPLPKKYHDLIKQKVKEGVRVIRYGFGSKTAFNMLAGKYPEVVFHYCKNKKEYQRMLVVDKKKAMFAVGDTKIYSENHELIIGLLKYIKIIYNRRKI